MTIELASDDIRVDIDPGRGADILALVDRRTGVDVLFRTPWRDRADAIRAGQTPSTTHPTAGWLEGYRGGWQTLCPVAGDPAVVHGAPVSFHGEASVVPWTVDASGADTVSLHVDLFSVPLRIERVVALEGPRLTVTDTLINLSPVDLRIDYVQHPAFGGPFLEGECVLDTGARMFVNDPAHDPLFAAGQVIAWPMATALDGSQVDLREVPSRGESRELFGWLEDFAEPWASITNRDIGLSVRVEWDGEHLPFAWLWQELESTPTFPWYRRARAVAIEPASVPTGGVDRSSVVVVPASGRLRIGMSLTLDHHTPGGTNA